MARRSGNEGISSRLSSAAGVALAHGWGFDFGPNLFDFRCGGADAHFGRGLDEHSALSGERLLKPSARNGGRSGPILLAIVSLIFCDDGRSFAKSCEAVVQSDG